MELQQLQIDPLLSEPGSESTLTRKHQQEKCVSCIRPDQGYHQYKPPANVHRCQTNREQEYWIEQVGHGHVCDQYIYRFSQSWCFINN